MCIIFSQPKYRFLLSRADDENRAKAEGTTYYFKNINKLLIILYFNKLLHEKWLNPSTYLKKN